MILSLFLCLFGLFQIVGGGVLKTLTSNEISKNYALFKTASFAPKYHHDPETLELQLDGDRSGIDVAKYEQAAALYNHALTLYRDQKMQHAIANFVESVRIYPGLADGWNNLSIIAQALAMMDEAAIYAALALIFSQPRVYGPTRSFASCHVNKFIKDGNVIDREIALVYLRKALEYAPKFEKEIVEAYNALLINGGDPNRCIEKLEQMEERFEEAPSEIQAMRLAAIATCHRDAHNGDLAVDYFEQAIEMNPTEATYHYELGGMFKRTEFPTLLDVGRSLVHVQQALELSPNSAIITYSLAGSYAIGRQLDPAIELYERAYRLDPNLEIAMVEAYHMKRTVCQWKNRKQMTKKLIAMVTKSLQTPLPDNVALTSTGLLLTPWHALSMELPPGMQLRLAQRSMHLEAAKGLHMSISEIDKLHKPYPHYEELAKAGKDFQRSNTVGIDDVAGDCVDGACRDGDAVGTSTNGKDGGARAWQQVDDDLDDMYDDDQGDHDGWDMKAFQKRFELYRTKQLEAEADGADADTDDEQQSGGDDDTDEDANDDRPPFWSPQALDQAIGSAEWRRAKLRVGVVSADISDSNVGQSLIGWLADPDLDEGRTFLRIYSLVDDDGTGWRRAMCDGEQRGERCVNVGAMPTDVLRKTVANDKIDVLINLNGFTKFSRNELFALRPAPISVNYKGYPGTMGAYHDYIIGDRVLTPLQHEHLYSEKIVQLPHSFFLTSYPEGFGHVLDAKVQEVMTEVSGGSIGLQAPGFTSPSFVFCNFNHLYKTTPEIFDVWMNALKAVPNSLLWLMHLPESAEKFLKREAAKRGVDKARLYFTPLFPLKQHLVIKQKCHLFLDTPIFNAHGTATDALWAGIPLLTLMGNTMQSRAAASHLVALGVPELITNTYQQYEELAIELAQGFQKRRAACGNADFCDAAKASRLAKLRARIEAARLTSHLFDSRRWWHDMKLSLRMMLAVHNHNLEHRHLVLPRNLDYSHIPAIKDYIISDTDAFYEGMREMPFVGNNNED